ncbi:hypothetical protein KC950_00465 [Candidatus Saccharibacteria bacterium]|nr:hypothetical protein [Candidatus Saccharibacteria bacterium]
MLTEVESYQVIQRDPVVDLQASIADKLRMQREQTITDRQIVAEFSRMEGAEREQFAGHLAMATTASFEDGDSLEIAARFNRLYASLSINTYEGILAVVDVDDILDVANKAVANTENPDNGKFQEVLFRSRQTGLNPVLRKKLEHLENNHIA